MLVKTRTNAYNTTYHLVWVTKYRKSMFYTKEKRNFILETLEGISKGSDVTVIESEVLPDHVHMVVSFPPSKSISSVMKSLKGSSAREWFKEYPLTKKELWGGSLWAASFFASTVGDVSKEIVLDYVQEQLTEYNSGRPRRDSSHG